MDNHKSDEIEIDLDFSDDISEELSVDLSESLPNKIEEVEDIVLDSKPLPFEDISEDIVVEEDSSGVEPRLVLELEDNSKTVAAKEDDEVIDLVNVVKEDGSSSSTTAPILDKAEATTELLLKDGSLESKIFEDKISMSEESIVAMFEKIVEKRYGGQLDAMLLQVVENIVNRQIDDIKKKILTALQ